MKEKCCGGCRDVGQAHPCSSSVEKEQTAVFEMAQSLFKYEKNKAVQLLEDAGFRQWVVYLVAE